MFLAPAFLAGLLAIGLPIWLHRVAKADPTRHPFASLMLLEATETQRTAKRTLRYLLLLALRIALLVALAFAFAGPLISPRAIPAINPNARLHAIVLDTSLSMQHSDRWSRALEQAEEVLSAASSGDQVMLVLGGGRRIQVAHPPVSAANAGSLRAALRNIKPGIERLDYGLLMMTAESWLGKTHLPVDLHLITDLQQSASPLRFADLEPPAGVQMKFHDVHNADGANAYIKSAALLPSDARTLSVEVATTQLARPESREIVVSVDGAEVGRKRVELRPSTCTPQSSDQCTAASDPPPVLRLVDTEGGPATPPVPAAEPVASANHEKATFPLTLAAGAHRIDVRIEPQDALPQDDSFHAVVEHADPRVLLISRSANADDTAYIAAAVASLTAPRLAIEQRVAQVIEERVLGGYSAVVVTDIAALSTASASRIRDYAEAGGAVLMTLGPGAADQPGGLVNGLRIREVQTQPTRVDKVDSSHAVLRNAAGWQAIRFFRHLKVDPAEGDKVLITLQDGAPLLIERTIGAGRMLLLTSPLDRDWNDLATHPLFVRFIAEAARYLTGGDTSATSSLVGSTVMTGLTARSGGQIFDPQGRRVLNLNETASADRLTPDQTGFYEVRSGQGVKWIAVNVDRRESDLTAMPSASLQRWQGLQTDQVAPATAASSEADTPVTPLSLGFWLLMIAVALTVMEILMANHYLAVRREVPR